MPANTFYHDGNQIDTSQIETPSTSTPRLYSPIDISKMARMHSRSNFISTMRVYFYTDNRWISVSDDNYGQNTENASESAGTGSDPIREWEVQGLPFRAGDRIHEIDIISRCNSAEVTDVEIVIGYITPEPITRWQTGFDNDAEANFTVLYADNWMNPAGAANELLTGPITDRMKRKLTIDHDVLADGELKIFFKPVGTLTATRYFYPTMNTYYSVGANLV